MKTRTTRDCMSCGRKYACVWEIDAWVCRFTTCGAEWYPTPGDEEYANPSGEQPDDVTFGAMGDAEPEAMFG